MSHWYCKVCRDRKEPEHVTFEENCADCGTPVDFIDVTRGMLFNKTQGDFYELTGRKPMFFTGSVPKGVCSGSLEYVEYLENIINSHNKG